MNDISDFKTWKYIGTPFELPRISSSFKNKVKNIIVLADRGEWANRDGNTGAD